MKKFFIALSVLAALMLSVVPSQALVGSPDDVPGSDFVVPFIADISGSTGLNTLIVMFDAMGGWGGTTTAAAVDWHYTVNTVRSVTVYDANVTGSAYDVANDKDIDAFSFLAAMSSTARTALEVDIDLDGTNDHYAGYVYFQAMNDNADENNTVGQFYFVNLSAGKAAAANIPMKEYSTTTQGAVVNATFRTEMVSLSGTDIDMELFFSECYAECHRASAKWSCGC
jgi:hypothetical protein